jgi:hypothetical protein
LSTLHSIFFLLRTWNLLLFIGGGRGQFCLHEGKIFSPWFCWEGSQPLVQSSLPELSNLQKKAAWVDLFMPSPASLCCHSSWTVHMGL